MKTSGRPTVEGVALDPPFSGVWRAFIVPADAEGAAGAFGRLLARATGHRHAFDFVGLDGNLKHRRPGSRWRRFAGVAGDHHAFSRTVLAPLDGEVVVARDGWPDRKRAGQPVGEVGNSGTSYAPHLHLQLLDGADPLTARSILMRFRRYERWNGGSWEPVRDGVPRGLEPIRTASGMGA